MDKDTINILDFSFQDVSMKTLEIHNTGGTATYNNVRVMADRDEVKIIMEFKDTVDTWVAKCK